MLYTKVCPVCGKDFETTQKARLYCGEKCYEKANREKTRKRNIQDRLGIARTWKKPRTCEICGTTFLPVKQNQILCGKKTCRDEKQRQRTRGYAEKPDWMVTPRTCAVCGTEFMPIMPNQTTCDSPDCKRKHRVKRQMAYNKAHKEELRQKDREWREARRAAKLAAKAPEQEPEQEPVQESESLRDAVTLPKEPKKRGRKPKVKPGSIAWCVAEADKRGMSYGMFVAALEMGDIEIDAGRKGKGKGR